MFTVAAATGGAVLFGLIGLVGLLRVARPLFQSLAIAFALIAAAWHLRSIVGSTQRRRFPFDRVSQQTNSRLASLGFVGMGYFGLVLGATLLTEMITPVILAAVLLCAAAGPAAALAIGAGLGAGRSLLLWRAVIEPTPKTPHTVVQRYVGRLGRRRFHAAGFCLSLFTVLVILLTVGAV